MIILVFKIIPTSILKLSILQANSLGYPGQNDDACM